MRAEISQLQQNGISAQHLDKMNPIAAATLKVLKSSRGLMEIYSELHAKISEVDQLRMDKERLGKSLHIAESELATALADGNRVTHELTELRGTADGLKSRLLSIVSELRASESRRSNAERQLLVVRKTAESSDREVTRLNEQVHTLLVATDGDSIKLEAVDADSGLYASVQELQDGNRALRMENEDLRVQLELSDSEQSRQRCGELQTLVTQQAADLARVNREHTAGRTQLALHEKQVRLLRFMLRMNAGNSAEMIEKGLRRLEQNDGDDEPEMEPFYTADAALAAEDGASAKQELCEQQQQQQFAQTQQKEVDCAMDELIDNKRASDEVYVASIEEMRSQLVELSRRSSDLKNKVR